MLEAHNSKLYNVSSLLYIFSLILFVFVFQTFLQLTLSSDSATINFWSWQYVFCKEKAPQKNCEAQAKEA